MTWQGSGSYNVANSSTLPPPTASTTPSQRPRCRLQTNSGYASASSRNGQCRKSMRVLPSSARPSNAGSKPSLASSDSSACRQSGNGCGDRTRRPRRGRSRRHRTRRRRCVRRARPTARRATRARADRTRARARPPRGSRGAGAPDRPPPHRFDVDEARFAESLEVQPHGVGVQRQTHGEILRRQCRRSSARAPGTWRSASRLRGPSEP